MYLFYLVCGSLIAKGTFQLHFDSIIEYTLTFTVSGTNLSRTFTNVSKILSAINANIFEYQYIFNWKRIYINMVTLDCAHSFVNNNVTVSCNIRYQIINELDTFTVATPVEIYVASWLHAQFILNYFK